MLLILMYVHVSKRPIVLESCKFVSDIEQVKFFFVFYLNFINY